MNESTIYQLVTGLLLPFAGTVVGCATVFFLQRQMGGAAAEGAPGFCRRGNDRGRCLVTSDSRHGNVGGGAGAFCRHCHTERSGGRHRLSAAVRRRNAEGQGVFVWGGVQRCRAYRGVAHDTAHLASYADASVFADFRRGRYDLCGGGGADSGGAGGRAQQHRHHRRGAGLCVDDGTGCGAGIAEAGIRIRSIQGRLLAK